MISLTLVVFSLKILLANGVLLQNRKYGDALDQAGFKSGTRIRRNANGDIEAYIKVVSLLFLLICIVA
jgi:preprotein translocase subunit SecG